MRQISEKNTGFFFDPAIPPVLTVESGEIVEFMTKDCYDGQIDIDNKDFFLLDMSASGNVMLTLTSIYSVKEITTKSFLGTL